MTEPTKEPQRLYSCKDQDCAEQCSIEAKGLSWYYGCGDDEAGWYCEGCIPGSYTETRPTIRLDKWLEAQSPHTTNHCQLCETNAGEMAKLKDLQAVVDDLGDRLSHCYENDCVPSLEDAAAVRKQKGGA